MLWFKLTGISLIFLSTTFLGFYYSERFSQRTQALGCAAQLVGALESRLSFTLDTPHALFFQLEKNPTFCLDYVTEARRQMEQGATFDAAFLAALEHTQLPFNTEDKRIFSELAHILGKSDADTQAMRLNFLEKSLEAQHQTALAREATEKKLVRTLSVLCGLAVSIFLV